MPPAMCKRSRRAVVASRDPGSFASLSNVTVALKPFLAHHCFASRIAMQHCTLSKFHSRSSMHFFNASRTARPEFLFKLVCGRYSKFKAPVTLKFGKCTAKVVQARVKKTVYSKSTRAEFRRTKFACVRLTTSFQDYAHCDRYQ